MSWYSKSDEFARKLADVLKADCLIGPNAQTAASTSGIELYGPAHAPRRDARSLRLLVFSRAPDDRVAERGDHAQGCAEREDGKVTAPR